MVMLFFGLEKFIQKIIENAFTESGADSYYIIPTLSCYLNSIVKGLSV